MDFKINVFIADLTAGAILVVRNSVRLVFQPYATMRTLAKRNNNFEVGLIWAAVFVYCLYATRVRLSHIHALVISSSSLRMFLFFLFTFHVAYGFMYGIGKLLEKAEHTHPVDWSSYRLLVSYTLIPTLLWFFITSTLYLIFPPPRFPTPLGFMYSLIFISFSSALLLWKLVLWYLALRFGLRARFTTIVGIMVLFALWFVPYSLLMYHFGIFRIPLL